MVAADQGRDQAELRFRELYQANFRPVQGYAVNRLGTADDVPDVVAEVFMIAWRRLADIPPPPAAVRLYQQITTQLSPGRPPRRRYAVPVLIGVAAAAVAATVALALTVPRAASSHRGGQGGTTLAAWSVVKEPHGLIKVTIRQLRDPAGLERTLRADGVPAHVRFVHRFFQASSAVHLPKGCRAPHLSAEAIAKLDRELIPSNVTVPSADAVIFRRSAIKHGLGLSLKAWAPKPGTHPAATLSMEMDLVQATPRCTG